MSSVPTVFPPLPKDLTGAGSQLPALDIMPYVQQFRQSGQNDNAAAHESAQQYSDALGKMIGQILAYLKQYSQTPTVIKIFANGDVQIGNNDTDFGAALYVESASDNAAGEFNNIGAGAGVIGQTGAIANSGVNGSNTNASGGIGVTGQGYAGAQFSRLGTGAGAWDIIVGSSNAVGIVAFAGNPNTHVTGSPGAICLNTNGGAGLTLYVKESGVNTNTGWVAK